MKIRKILAFASTLVLLVTAIGTMPAWAAAGVVTQVPISGTGSLSTGDFAPSGNADVTQAEYPGQGDEAIDHAGLQAGEHIGKRQGDGRNVGGLERGAADLVPFRHP